MRIAIAGVPRAGKTTLCAGLGDLVLHTDDLMSLGWSECSAAAAAWMTRAGSWVVEGVAVARALRKAMAASPATPCDRVIHMTRPRVPLTKGQVVMARGCLTVWLAIEPELRRRGVEILTDPEPGLAHAWLASLGAMQ